MMLLNNIILAAGVALMVAAKFAMRLEMMIVGRLIHGLNSGRCMSSIDGGGGGALAQVCLFAVW